MLKTFRVDSWPFNLYGMCAEICGEQFFVFFEAHYEKSLSIGNVLPLNQMVDHLCVKHVLYRRFADLVLVFEACEG